MHSYATDSNERVRIIASLAVISVGVCWALSQLLAAARLTIPWWVDAPSTMGIFGVFFEIFDKIVWRWRLLHKVGLVRVPVLDGNWKGRLQSSFDQYATEHEVGVRIRQSWTRLAVDLKSGDSTSHSIVGTIQVKEVEEPVLSYQYRNEPRVSAVETMHIHYGTARLVLRDDEILDGEYYSGRDRQNHGEIHLKKSKWMFLPSGTAGAQDPRSRPSIHKDASSSQNATADGE